MAKRGRKKKFKLKFNIRSETIRSVVAVLLIVFSGISLVTAVTGSFVESSYAHKYMGMVFGNSLLFLSPVLFVSGLLLINNIKWRIAELRVLLGFLSLFLAFSGLFQVIVRENAYETALNGGGGGILGYYMTQLLSSLISVYGAVIVFLGFLILSIILVFDKSLEELISTVGGVKASKLTSKLLRRSSSDGEGAGDTDDDEDIKISSGLNLDGDDPIINKKEDMIDPNEESKPSFEIVPSMSEPQNKTEPKQEEADSDTIMSLAPTLPYSDKMWQLPPLDLLESPSNAPVDRGDVKQRAKIIEDTLESFGIKTKVKDIRFGPSVTQYALEAESGTKITKIASLQYDLALALASPTGSVRIEAPIPGRSLIGIEVPNNNRVTVNFKEVLTSDSMKSQKSKISTVLGLDVGGKPITYNIGKMPHLLIAGATGSGKSVFIHNIMFSILFNATPQEVKFILIDPKRVELVLYNGIPQLLSPVVTDIDKAPSVFKWAVSEMDRRYKLLETAKVRNIDAYNRKSGFQAMPYIVIIVDELAEIMVADPAAVEKSIIRLAQLARAVGIHLMLAMQRPSTNIITGLIKANIPCRIAFNVTSQVDSRVILDQPGAEKLLGKGDMLFVPPDDSKPMRIQGAMVSDKEINDVVSFLKKSGVEPEYSEDIFDVPDKTKSISAGGDAVDALYEDAIEVIMSEGKASASLLQRRLSIGYSRAARIIDEMEANGIVGPAKGSKPRDILSNSITGE